MVRNSLRVNGRHSIGAVRANNGKVRHADFALAAFFHEADALHTPLVAWEAKPNFIEQPTVDLVNDLQVTRKQSFKPRHRPFLQSLGQQGVIGVSKRLLRQVPGLIPSHVHVVQQDSHQFRDRHGRMRVIELNRGFLWKFFPIRVVALETAHQVGHGTCDQEILLQKAQALPLGRRVVGIQHAGQRFRLKSFAERAHEVSSAKLFKIEIIGRRRGPEPERVDRLSTIADDRTIKRDTDQARGPVGDDVKITALQLE